MLPNYCVTIWLSSSGIPGNRAGKSGLVVVFFADYVNGIEVGELLGQHLAGLNWKELAWNVRECVDNVVGLRLVKVEDT